MIILLAAAVMVSAICVLPPGMPQPADLILAGGIVCMIVANRINDRAPWLIALACFAYVFIINVSWWAAYHDKRFILSAAFYLYNLMVMLVVASMMIRDPDRFIRWVRRALLAALAIETVALVVLMGSSVRSQGTFNNPNQLAYWGLLIAALWFSLKPREPLRAVDFVFLSAAVTFGLISGSRAGLAGAGMLTVIALVVHRVTWRWVPALGLAAFIAILSTGAWLPTVLEQPAIERIGKNKAHDSLEARGYDRLWLYPEHLVLGSGEGAFDRFEEKSAGGDNEIHSLFGTVLFSYGMAGASLFAVLLWSVFRHAEWRHVLYLAPVGFYCVTHNGVRDTLLWSFFGIVIALSELRRRQQAPAQLAPDPAAIWAGYKRAPAVLEAEQ